jgi:hypothetical protein
LSWGYFPLPIQKTGDYRMPKTQGPKSRISAVLSIPAAFGFSVCPSGDAPRHFSSAPRCPLVLSMGNGERIVYTVLHLPPVGGHRVR